MGSGLFLTVLLFYLFPISLKAEQASFYGNSYISIPLEESKTTTEIFFKFRTRLSDTLILLVAGETDYCKVDLENGRIRVVVNLGSGEAELVSHSTNKLNDFKWHEVTITRRDGNLSMLVDKARKIHTKIPGKHFELNIHYGIFVGDHRNKNNTDLFFGHIKTFRGCLSGLKYNDLPVLETARQRESKAIVEAITWNCAAEFEASLEQPISFVEDDAFLVIPQKTKFKDFSIRMELKTMVSDGLIFYNPGTTRHDFLMLEISNYNLSATVKAGDKAVKVHITQRPVADGKWNRIGFRLTSTTVELSLNEHLEYAKNVHASLVQLSDISYIGGLEAGKKFRATQKGCGTACDLGFKGCMQNLHIADARTGLPDAQSSDGLLPSCVWNYPCLRHPCQEGATCVQRGLDSFQCRCPNNIDTTCVQRNYTEGYSVYSRPASLATELELLSVEPLEVLEGGSEIITTTNLHLVLDYKKYGIKDAGVSFTVEQSPEHGAVTVDGWPQRQSFSLLDVARDKVHYVHDGSEIKRDNIALSVAFSAAQSFTLPVYLQGTFRFSLIVNIVPKNDAPVFDLSETKVLRVVQGAKKVITSDLFQTDDPDNSPSELVYRIIQSDVGYFENLRKLGAKVDSFTQEDVNKKKILFVHTGPDASDSYVSLEVSDGVEVSPIYQVRVSVTAQVWRLDKNTGLQLLHQTYQIITPYNLSYTSNVPNSDYNVLFKIIKKPSFGEIEVDRSPNIWEPTKSMSMWEPTDVFLSTDLKQHKVRYRHTIGEPQFDEFQFRTALNKTQLYTFRLTFVECKLLQVSSKILELNSAWETPITTKSLLFETRPTKSSAFIMYQVLKYPQYGYLFSAVSKYRIKCFDNFTQEDVLSENIRYRLYQKAFSDVSDSIILSVKSPGCGNVTANVTIKYYPSNEDKFKVQVNIKQLDVDEGMSAVIDRSHLYIHANFVSDLIFNVTTPPQHGILQTVVDDRIRNHTKAFSVQQLNENSVFYLHDGSESEQDSFKFMALSNTDETFQYVGQMQINVHLKNDHAPIRVVDKVFQVVVGGEKLLTDKDLKFVDMDLGTPPAGIIYTCREIPNGQFYNLRNQTKNITEFTQEDLDTRNILFKHKGPEYAKVRLWVTDGQFHVNGILEIQASGPFIHIEVNKKIIVESGKSIILTTDHVQYSTNLYTTDSKVTYHITRPPVFGKIVDSKNGLLNNFTQEDVNLENVRYHNDVTTGNADEIGLKVTCKDALNVAQLAVLILPSSYWEPLQLKRLKKLTVEESTSALITKDNLEVIQTNVHPSIINFHIHERPQYGYLTILSESKNGSEIINMASFTQELINENRVLYIQAAVNQSRDTISFNVTNGLVWLPNVRLEIMIIPEHWYLGSNDIVVNEGGSITLSPVYLYVETEYYRSIGVTFKMIQSFNHGCLQIFKQCSKSKSFNSYNLTAGTVEYVHDGSENIKDAATFIAQVGERKSEPIKVFVKVVPVNDHVPKLVNNTGLEMWEGGTAVITNSMLAAIDEDVPKETLKYHVQSCWWGNVSLITDENKAFNYFTQEFINNGLVIFRHHNGSRARFLFNISDGLHTTKDYLFEIKTKKVQMKLFTNKPLHIFPLQKKVLTNENLHTKNSDGRRILYEITKPPTLGRLMMKSKKKEYNSVVSNFTQEDIDNESIYYEHLHPFSDLYANDSFIFTVNSYLAPTLVNEIFRIDISVSSGGLDSYVQIPKIEVKEGEKVSIHMNLSEVVKFLEMHAGMRSPVIHVSAEIPRHGKVFLKDDPHSGLMTFTQQQLESGNVYYQHDNSDTLSDTVKLSLYLIPNYIMLCNLTANITVIPVNDQPFKLVTQAPKFSVVQGENHTITREELCTEDADTPPKELKYDVVAGPTSGRLLLLPDLEPVNHFTQHDVDQNRLIYVHESVVLKDSFHLRIWDEQFHPEFTFFNIMVIPVNISIKAGFPVEVKQGTNVGFLNDQNIFVETNTDESKISYYVSKRPKHGVIYKDNNQTVTFSQDDLYRNHVMYLQFDTTASNDTFNLIGQLAIGNLTFKKNIKLCVEVKPFMHIHDCTVKAGKITKLTQSYLDATPLAKLTGSNPKYTVIALPSFCQIRKIIRSSGEKRHVLDTLVKTFTHEEIQGGLIHLDIKDIEVPPKGLTDKIVFSLVASLVQPATGELNIIVTSIDTNDILSTLPEPSDPLGHELDILITDSYITRDYVLIVTIVLAVVLTTIVIIIIIKCKSMERDTLHKEEVAMGPLPRPPDRLLASPVKSIGMTTPTPAAPPQCKVTPLGMTEFDAPSPHAGYPYGVTDELPDDWSSVDNSSDQASKSIMLRRNQYWV
ncbi:chondroitin sulfate proteoglycan 4 isoform X2 [Anthonomus grandis grandis]|uniref:chondroitin sulfate proteoglycan 4 isoform X2 n=1 Tax=Anthonomus grandis grandis TaxID=2921223 RepID=UPI0021653B4A|nr:chondroitin sulfate proteoglycan 4 isoform X2 [Anthonomus grandis grandis]